MEKIFAAVVGLAIASNSYAMDNLATTDMPLSVTEASAALVQAARTPIDDRDATGTSHMDEVAGAALIGGYLLYRARRARIV